MFGDVLGLDVSKIKDQAKSDQLPIVLLWGLFSIAAAFIVLLISYFTISSHQWVDEQFSALEQEVLEQQNEKIRIEVLAAASQIKFAISQAEIELRREAQSQVKQALSIAQVLYDKYHGVESEAYVQELIRESLRSLTFFNGRGYIFINSLDGQLILLPPKPQLEGQRFDDQPESRSYRLIQEAIKTVDNPRHAGFRRYQYPLPGHPDGEFEKISYLEVFEPYGWIFGAGDYVHQIEEDMRSRELKRLDHVRFGAHGYIAVLQTDGTLLKSLGLREYEAYPLDKLPDMYGRQLFSILDLAEKGGGFLSYPWKVPGSDKISPKHSYVLPLPEWDWVLVSGYYAEDLRDRVAAGRSKVDERYQTQRNHVMFFVLLVGGLALLLVFTYTRWLGRRFKRYQEKIESHQRDLEASAEALLISDRIVSSATEGILVTDADNRILHVNDAVIKMTGYSRKELIGELPSLLSSGRHLPCFYQQMWQTLSEEGRWQGEVWNRRKNGESYPEWLSLSVFKDDHGQVVNYIATFTDITQRKKDQAQLSYLAQFDSLTELPNRRLLIDRLTQHLNHIERHADFQIGVLFVDLDHFKDINDTLGHSAGDQVLVEVAKRLSSCVRHEDTVSRLGGDEFVVLIVDGEDASSQAARVALRILQQLAEPILVSEEELHVTASIGIAMAPSDGDNVETLMKHADTALYHAKHEGRNNFQFFTQSMNLAIIARMDMEKRIRQALIDNDFELYYQPQFNTQSGEIEGVEALIRWRDEKGGFIAPDLFIPVAEETGQIIEMGDWVLKTAIDQIKQWRAEGINLGVSVNVSSRQLRSTLLTEKLDLYLRETGINPGLVILEVTETALVENLDVARDLLHLLKQRGVGLSLDDFGTGYSSLTLLKQLPVNELKIDRSFIDGLPDDSDDVAITSSLVTTAHNMGIEVVAEGVESAEQLAFLQQINCDKTQGYYYSKAVTAEEVVSRFIASK